MSSWKKIIAYGLFAGAAFFYLGFTIQQAFKPAGFGSEIGTYLGMMAVCPTPLLIVGIVLLRYMKMPEPAAQRVGYLSPQACERCGEVHDSLEYTFFYGNRTSEMTVGRTRTTHYTIAGSRQVRLCDHCVADYYMAYHRKIALIMLGIAVGSAVLGGALVVGFILAALLLLVVFYFLFYWIKGGLMQHKQGQALRAAVQTERGVEMGDELAKSIYGKILKPKGFDSFFTRSEYKKLEVKQVRLTP